ncbi:MAG: hypothetical protein AABY13_03915 [Nanoarchaeota archaeon]
MKMNISYDRRSVERRRLARPHTASTFVYWIFILIAVAFLLSILK